MRPVALHVPHIISVALERHLLDVAVQRHVPQADAAVHVACVQGVSPQDLPPATRHVAADAGIKSNRTHPRAERLRLLVSRRVVFAGQARA